MDGTGFILSKIRQIRELIIIYPSGYIIEIPLGNVNFTFSARRIPQVATVMMAQKSQRQ